MSEWRDDMENAPRDGRRLLGAFEWFDADGREVVCVGTIVWRKRWGGVSTPSWIFEEVNDSFHVNPTHWKHLDPPPDPPQ